MKVYSVEHLKNKLEETIQSLNRTKRGSCWVCGNDVDNWGVMLPSDAPGGLGFGVSVDENGETNTRIAFFPYCAEHDTTNEVVAEKIRMRWRVVRAEMNN